MCFGDHYCAILHQPYEVILITEKDVECKMFVQARFTNDSFERTVK
jgi:hypothetical protein